MKDFTGCSGWRMDNGKERSPEPDKEKTLQV